MWRWWFRSTTFHLLFRMLPNSTKTPLYTTGISPIILLSLKQHLWHASKLFFVFLIMEPGHHHRVVTFLFRQALTLPRGRFQLIPQVSCRVSRFLQVSSLFILFHLLWVYTFDFVGPSVRLELKCAVYQSSNSKKNHHPHPSQLVPVPPNTLGGKLSPPLKSRSVHICV